MAANVSLVNIGTLVTGDLQRPIDSDHDAIVIEDGRIAAITTSEHVPDSSVLIDARGRTVVPALIDGHSHPVIAGFNPRAGIYDFIDYYHRAGIVGMVSAGAVHFPGFHGQTADLSVAIAKSVTQSYELLRTAGKPRVDGACLLATDDMTASHLKDANDAGVRRLKFIYQIQPERRVELARAAQELGWIVMLHCGGPATYGSDPLSYEEILALAPDVLLHLNGGPTALPDETLTGLVQNTAMMIDLVKFGNPSKAVMIARALAERGELDRLVLGTDSPTMNGINPSGIWFVIGLLSSVGGLKPEDLVAAATGRPAHFYWNETRALVEGAPGSLLCIDGPRGGSSLTALGALANGDLPGMGAMVTDGQVTHGVTYTIPPAECPVKVTTHN